MSTARTTEPVFLRPADARRMEAAEEYGALRYAQAVKQLDPQHAPAWEKICGGHMVFVARGYPVGRAHGLGFAGKITPENIQQVEDFYFARSSDAQVDVCPYADPSLFEAVNQRGFQVLEFNQTLARWILPGERFAPPALHGIEIRRIKPHEAVSWSAMLARVFLGEHAPRFESMFIPWAAPQHPMALAAFAGDKMVAGAQGLLVPEYGMAGFFGAGTLPEYRGRGIQQAFMRERLRIAQQAGCDLAVTLTMPGTTSQRNVERAGFRAAYTKVVVCKRNPAGDSAGPVPVQYSA